MVRIDQAAAIRISQWGGIVDPLIHYTTTLRNMGTTQSLLYEVKGFWLCAWHNVGWKYCPNVELNLPGSITRKEVLSPDLANLEFKNSSGFPLSIASGLAQWARTVSIRTASVPEEKAIFWSHQSKASNYTSKHLQPQSTSFSTTCCSASRPLLP